MADLIIKGMEMPKGCFYCSIGVDQCFTGTIRCPLLGKSVGYFDEVKNKRDMNCPLVPLPEKHGRLIDAAEVLKKAENSPWFDGDVSELGLLLGSEVTTIVPVVRCKDCLHWEDNLGYCDVWEKFVSNQDLFCGCGKRGADNG